MEKGKRTELRSIGWRARLFVETQRLLATLLQPAALALLAARAKTRQGYCHPLVPLCTPKDKVGGEKKP